MEAQKFTAMLLRASQTGYAGLAASRLVDDAEATPEAFDDWKGRLEQQILELAAALDAGQPEHFAEHLVWMREALAARGTKPESLQAGLTALRDVLDESLTPDTFGALPAYFDAAERALAGPAEGVLGQGTNGGPHTDLVDRYVEALRAGDAPRALAVVATAVEGGAASWHDALEHVLVPAMRRVGELWHRDELDVAEEHFATHTTARALSLALDRAPQRDANGRSVLLASVAGDSHDLGLRVVAAFFELDGWRVHYLGSDTPARDLAQAADRHGVDVVALGATLAIQREAVSDAVQALRNGSTQPRVLVGGGAFSPSEQVWRPSGADGFAGSPSEALRMANAWVNGS